MGRERESWRSMRSCLRRFALDVVCARKASPVVFLSRKKYRYSSGQQQRIHRHTAAFASADWRRGEREETGRQEMKENVIKMKERSKVWLDCDPGHDDAVAILLAGYSPDQVELIGISTVHGNQSVAKTTTNALACLEAFGLSNVTCVKGQGQPLFPHTERIKPEGLPRPLRRRKQRQQNQAGRNWCPGKSKCC